MAVKLGAAKGAVVKVGHGRGFVMECDAAGGVTGRIVLTCAHCLPRLPPAHGWSNVSDRTYKNLLASLGNEPTIWCECIFVDPVADVAVLAEPDGGAGLAEQCEAFEALVNGRPTVPFGSTAVAAHAEEPAYILSLAGEWIWGVAKAQGRTFWLQALHGPIEGGMSGSPIVTETGGVIGMMALAGTANGQQIDIQPQTRLPHALPLWLSQSLKRQRRRRAHE